MENSETDTFSKTIHEMHSINYVSIPIQTMKKLDLKKGDIVLIKIAKTRPPADF